MCTTIRVHLCRAATLGILLGIVLAMFEVTQWDLFIQDLMYDFEQHQWRVPRNWAIPRAVFYHGMKYGVILIGSILLVSLTFTPGLRARLLPATRGSRAPVFAAVLMIAGLPAGVGWLKQTTDVYFPSQITRYGGDKPYLKLFEQRPQQREPGDRGRGFPAGHASGGFALIGLVMIVPTVWRRRTLAAALGYGSCMAAYQTLNGAHYLSHSVTTLLLALILLALMEGSLQLFQPNRQSSYAQS